MDFIFSNKFINRIICIVILSAGLCSSVYGQDLKSPDNRILIGAAYTGIKFENDDNTRYVPVRQFFELSGANVLWSEENLVTVEYQGEQYFPDFYIKNNTAYVKEDFITEVLGHAVTYYEQINALAVAPAASQDEKSLLNAIPTYNGYSQEDLKWLSQIIHAEANGEPYEAKLAVGNVILNRVSSQMYPNTIKDVIFDKNCGVQFTPTTNGSVYNTPSTESFLAAVEVLEGKRNADGVLFFINPRYAKSTWVSRNRTYAFTMNNHDFYY